MFHSDYESAGDGTLSVAATKTVTSNNGDVTITAWDLDLDGQLTAGTRSICLHGAKILQTIGLGSTTSNMHISNSEVLRVTTSGGVMIGSVVSGLLTLNGISKTGSNSISPIVTLIADRDDQQILVTGSGSTFISLAMQADNGISVEADLVTSGTSLYLEGDADEVTDSADQIVTADARTLEAKTVLTLQSRSGGVRREGRLSLREPLSTQ